MYFDTYLLFIYVTHKPSKMQFYSLHGLGTYLVYTRLITEEVLITVLGIIWVISIKEETNILSTYI